jgi:hypothetical protein
VIMELFSEACLAKDKKGKRVPVPLAQKFWWYRAEMGRFPRCCG